MVRMKDVLKSARDVLRTAPEKSDEAAESEAKQFSFPSSIPRPPTTEVDQDPPISKSFPRTGQPSFSQSRVMEEPKPAPVSLPSPEPAKPKKDLYHETIDIVDKFLKSLGKGFPLDLDPIEAQVNLFTESLKAGDQLFMQALSSRQTFTSLAQHSVNVAIISIKVANGMQYSQEKVVEVGIASMVHEVGMSQVPEEVVSKKGELTPSEYEMIKQHPIHGRNILEEVRNIYPFLPDVIAQEHERWDGSGYPFGLRESEIHEYAQILGMADTFVALTHLRHYRDNFIAYKAIQSIIERRNKDFSARMIKVLIDVISIFPVHSLVKLNDGSVARVLQTNKAFPVRPIIEVIQDIKGVKFANPEKLDLSKEPMIYIVSPVLDENAYS